MDSIDKIECEIAKRPDLQAEYNFYSGLSKTKLLDKLGRWSEPWAVDRWTKKEIIYMVLMDEHQDLEDLVMDWESE